MTRHIGYSLDNLRTDHIDIYQFHNVSNGEALEQILSPGGPYEVVEEARKAGKIGFIGFSSHDIATAVKGCRTGRFSTLQFPFNFIEKEPADELFVAARNEDMGIIGMKPLGGGLLERADLCFKFLQQYPYVLPIPGISTIEEADEIVGLYESPQPLSETDVEDIEEIRDELGTKFCHRCGYCLPCEQEVLIPSVMGFRSQSKRFPPQLAINMVKKAMETVDDCIECRECIERCPYNLEIPDVLKENLSLYNNFVTQHG